MKTILLTLLCTTALLLTAMASAQDAPLFHVVPNNTLNLRACGSLDCTRVGQVPGGTELPVHAVRGNWYQVLVDGELVWVAAWLTTLSGSALSTSEAIGTRIASEIGATLTAVANATATRFATNNIATATAVAAQTFSSQATGTQVFRELQQATAAARYTAAAVYTAAAERYRQRVTGTHAALATASAYPTITPSPTRTPTPTPSPTRTPTVTPSPTLPPDKVLETGEVLYFDSNTGCFVSAVSIPSNGRNLTIHLVNVRTNGVTVKIFRSDSGEQIPLADESETDRTRIYFLPDGFFRLQIERDEKTTRLDWHFTGSVEGTSRYYLRISCHGDDSLREITPDRTIATGVLYRDFFTGCDVQVLDVAQQTTNRRDLRVIRYGEGRNSVRVDIWLPDEADPLALDNELHSYDAAGEPFIWQNYSPQTDWRNGLYRIEVSRGDAPTVLGWRMEQAGQYRVKVTCHQPAGPTPSV